MTEDNKDNAMPTPDDYKMLELPFSAAYRENEHNFAEDVEVAYVKELRKYREYHDWEYYAIKDAYQRFLNLIKERESYKDKHTSSHDTDIDITDDMIAASTETAQNRIKHYISKEREVNAMTRALSTQGWQCPTCLKSFATKQKLQQHETKRYKCSPPSIPTEASADDEQTKPFVCVCGKSYSYHTGLARHKTTCDKCYHATTLPALKTPMFKVNDYGRTTKDYDVEYYAKAFNDTCTDAERFRMRHNKGTMKRTDFKKLFLEMLETIYFKTPKNFTFYVPNVNMNEVWINRAGKMVLSNRSDVKEHMINTVVSEFLDILREHDMVPEDEEDKDINPIFHILSEFEGDDDACKHIKKYILKTIDNLISQYKDDVKAVWKNMKLI